MVWCLCFGFGDVVYFGVADSVFLLFVLCWRFPGVLILCVLL